MSARTKHTPDEMDLGESVEIARAAQTFPTTGTPAVARDETRLRAEALPVVAELLSTALRAPATLLALVFEPADDDECLRGYVAWERADQCGTHAFTVHLRAFTEGYELAKPGHMPALLHGGVYDLPGACEALADLSDRASGRRA